MIPTAECAMISCILPYEPQRGHYGMNDSTTNPVLGEKPRARFGRRQFLSACLATTAAGCVSVKLKHDKAVCDPNLVALISDIHVALPFSEQKYRTGREYPHVNATIQKFVSEILALRPLPANVIALGDISLAFAEHKEYVLCRQFLKPLEDAGIKVTHAMGNHDRVDEFLAAYPEYKGRGGFEKKLVSEVSTPHADFIVLDSHVECAVNERGKYSTCTGYDLGARQLAWLKERLASAKKPTFVCSHHQAPDLKIGKLIARAPTVFGYLHGHHHHWMTNYIMDDYGKNAKKVLQFGLPSFGLDNDVGYGLMRIGKKEAEVSCVARDFYFPLPAEFRPQEGGPGRRPASWDAFRKNWDGRVITFAFDK